MTICQSLRPRPLSPDNCDRSQPPTISVHRIQDSQGFLDRQGGRYHLWFAIISAVIACITGILMFYFFGRHTRNEWSNTPKVPFEPAITVTSRYPTANSPAPAPLDAVRWAQQNPWLSEGQADDRSPMRGTDGLSSGPLSVRRPPLVESSGEYKKWSQRGTTNAEASTQI